MTTTQGPRYCPEHLAPALVTAGARIRPTDSQRAVLTAIEAGASNYAQVASHVGCCIAVAYGLVVRLERRGWIVRDVMVPKRKRARKTQQTRSKFKLATTTHRHLAKGE